MADAERVPLVQEAFWRNEKLRHRLQLAEDRARRDPVWAEKMARRHAEFNAKRAALAAVPSPSSAAAVASEVNAAVAEELKAAPAVSLMACTQASVGTATVSSERSIQTAAATDSISASEGAASNSHDSALALAAPTTCSTQCRSHDVTMSTTSTIAAKEVPSSMEDKLQITPALASVSVSNMELTLLSSATCTMWCSEGTVTSTERNNSDPDTVVAGLLDTALVTENGNGAYLEPVLRLLIKLFSRSRQFKWPPMSQSGPLLIPRDAPQELTGMYSVTAVLSRLFSLVVMWNEAVLWPSFQFATGNTIPLLPWDPGVPLSGMDITLSTLIDGLAVRFKNTSEVTCLQGNSIHELFSCSFVVELIQKWMLALVELQPWPSWEGSSLITTVYHQPPPTKPPDNMRILLTIYEFLVLSWDLGQQLNYGHKCLAGFVFTEQVIGELLEMKSCLFGLFAFEYFDGGNRFRQQFPATMLSAHFHWQIAWPSESLEVVHYLSSHDWVVPSSAGYVGCATSYGAEYFEWQIAWPPNLKTMQLKAWSSCANFEVHEYINASSSAVLVSVNGRAEVLRHHSCIMALTDDVRRGWISRHTLRVIIGSRKPWLQYCSAGHEYPYGYENFRWIVAWSLYYHHSLSARVFLVVQQNCPAVCKELWFRFLIGFRIVSYNMLSRSNSNYFPTERFIIEHCLTPRDSGDILVHVLCLTRPHAHIPVSRPDDDCFSYVLVLGQECITIQPARNALHLQQANTTFLQAGTGSRFIGYSSLSGSELLHWNILWPLDLVCSANGYKSGQLLHPTIVSSQRTASTVPFQFLSYVAIWSSRSPEFCQGKLSWDPGIWATFCFFGLFTQFEATGRRNVAAPACYHNHCFDHAYYFDKVCADVFRDQVHLGNDYYLGVFLEQGGTDCYLNLIKVCLDYNNHRDLGEVMKHQVPWDPGGSTWHRLEVKPEFKEGGMLATSPTLSCWAMGCHWWAWAALKSHEAAATNTGESGYGRLGFGTDGFGLLASVFFSFLSCSSSCKRWNVEIHSL